MALSDEEKELLKRLQEKENTPDEDQFDIEIWDETGAGAKVPYHKGRTWLQRFGIDLPEEPPAEPDKPAKGNRGTGTAANPDSGGTAQRYFGGSRNSKAS